MSVHIPTVKICSDDTALGYVIINESDYNPDEHDLFEESEEHQSEEGEPGPVSVKDMTESQLKAFLTEKGASFDEDSTLEWLQDLAADLIDEE